MVSSISSSSGSISASALKQMQEEMFKAVDTNSDNKIDKSELSAFQKSQEADGKKGGPGVDDMFAKMDTDNDSAISRLESDAAIAKISQQMQSRESGSGSSSGLKEALFKSADQNGDGGISKDELTTLMADSSQSSTDVSQIFDSLDTNSDGVISKSESDAGVDKAGQQKQAQGSPPPPPPPPSESSSSSDSSSSDTIYDALDTNKDGTVSASELLASLMNNNSNSADDSSSESGASSSGSSGDEITVKKIFDAMDTNQDGSVSKTELEAALAKSGKQKTSGTASGSSSSGAFTASSSPTDSSVLTTAIKSYVQAGMQSISRSTTESTLSASAVYG